MGLPNGFVTTCAQRLIMAPTCLTHNGHLITERGEKDEREKD